MSELFIPGQTIGIIGGGHIARMLTLSAKSIGFQVGILDPEQGCSASEIADWQIVSEFNDENAMVKMAEKCDVLTFEETSMDMTLLNRISSLVSIPQSFELLEFPQNRLLERGFLDASNINIAPYATINRFPDIDKHIDAIGFPCILKTVHQRSGNNQHTMNRISDIRGCLPLVKSGTCILEAVIPFKKEIAVMIVGNGNGNYSKFPIAETSFDRQSEFTRAVIPANISEEIEEEIYRIADDIAITLNVQGVLTIEMFITESDMIYVNSISAGPHSSGVYSIEATNLSQFDAHIRGICGWQLPFINLYSPAIVLRVVGDQLIETISYIPFEDNWYHHYYGKQSLSKTETVGHITVLADDLKDAQRRIANTDIWS